MLFDVSSQGPREVSVVSEMSRSKSDPRRATLPTKLLNTAFANPTAPLNWGVSRKVERPTKSINSVPIYDRMQAVVQKMLHSDRGVPIRSYKRRLISAIPSAFTGSDMVTWLMKNLNIRSKNEAIHLANLLSRHGFFFCVEGLDVPVRDDGTLYRFQTPYYWPSQNPVDTDYEYGVYLVKQVLRSKHRIRLLDYELNNLHKLKLRLAKEWRSIAEKAEVDVKVFREQKRVAKVIIGSQEEAFWRLHRPPPGESRVSDSTLTRLCTERIKYQRPEWTMKSLRAEILHLQSATKRTRVHLSTSLEGIINFVKKYDDFDPMLTQPFPSNPWVSGDSTLWTLDKSLVEHPSERQVRKWACSFQDLLTDVTGRYKFEAFCKTQFCLENVRFWQACHDLKSIPLMAVEGSVKLIYDEFLQRGASSEVNVSANVQTEVERDVKTPSRYAFTAAQEQIYHLMQNDIYPRFLKSKEYQEMLKDGKMLDHGGRGFFSRFQHGQRKTKLDAGTRDATGISPCLPQRYTRRQLSISRKISSTGSGSVDDIILATSYSNQDFTFGSKRASAYTEAFIDAITAPNATKILSPDRVRQRRVSAPNTNPAGPTGRTSRLTSNGSVLDQVFEETPPPTMPTTLMLENAVPMSYSADDLHQLHEDADKIGPSKWKKYGMAAIFTTELLSPPMTGNGHLAPNGNIHQRSSVSKDLKCQKREILQVPMFGLGKSPKTGAFEFESIDHPMEGGGAGLKVASSMESFHSTASQ